MGEKLDDAALKAHLTKDQVKQLNEELFGVPDVKTITIQADQTPAHKAVATLSDYIQGEIYDLNHTPIVLSVSTYQAQKTVSNFVQSEIADINSVPLKKHATGGPVQAGVPVITGDGGRPEVFVPNSDGRIYPSVGEGARALAKQGGGDTFNFNYFGPQHPTPEQRQVITELREAQAMTLSLPNTGMAVITDIGERNDIHPRNKQDVGKRLAFNVLKNVYAKPVVPSGPVFKSMDIQGDKAWLSFTDPGTGLMVKDRYGYLKGFEVAGADGQFHYAKASVINGKVVVSSDQVAAPVTVRYNWADDAADGNLFNKEGLPAAPFRTDTWKGVTEGKGYQLPAKK